MKKVIVTGGAGFIGAYLVRKFDALGWDVGVVDNYTRSFPERLASLADRVKIHKADVRNEDQLSKIFEKTELVVHLAAVNGTENFYTNPDLVLDVGVRGIISVVNACRRANVQDLIVASSAEVYQCPNVVPTPEDIPLMLPNSKNPRYSYGASKIISELIAFNYHRSFFRKLQVFRPHNIYGPDMGFKHVIPNIISSALRCTREGEKILRLKGSGTDTRAFCYVDDAVDAIVTMYSRGETREIFHIGSSEEISISHLAKKLLDEMNLNLSVEFEDLIDGGTPRRCPDINKISKLGFEPKIGLEAGLRKTVSWYSKTHQIISASNSLV